MLWCAIQALQKAFPKRVRCVIYSGEAVSGDRVLGKVESHFNIGLDRSTISFVAISSASLLDPRRYPRFTLAMQSLGAMVVGLECLARFQPTIVIDTTG